MDKKQYYTIKEVAKMLNLSKQAIHKRLFTRKIESLIFGKTKVIKSIDLELVLR